MFVCFTFVSSVKTQFVSSNLFYYTKPLDSTVKYQLILLKSFLIHSHNVSFLALFPNVFLTLHYSSWCWTGMDLGDMQTIQILNHVDIFSKYWNLGPILQKKLSTNYEFLHKAYVFDPIKPFQFSLMFSGKAWDYPSAAPFRFTRLE